MNLMPRGILAYLAGQAQKVYGNAMARAVSSANPVSLTTAGAGTLTAALLAPGNVIQRTGPGAGFTDTTDTAANLTAAYPEIEVGESFTVDYANMVAQTATFGAGVGVTLTTGGAATNTGSGKNSKLILTKDSATAWSVLVLN